MKKIYYLAALGALTFASCSDDLKVGTNNGNNVEGDTKVVAKFEKLTNSLETRTTIESNNNGTYTYLWSESDAIGLFNIPAEGVTEQDFTNEVFRYVTSDGNEEAEFTGWGGLLEDGGVYGYYPYYGDAYIQGNYVYPKINARQNFYGGEDYQVPVADLGPGVYANGSFAQNAAPSVAYGTKDGENVEINFYGVASYLVIPVVGYSNLKTVTLAIKDSEGNYFPLTGEVEVDMTQFDPEVVATYNPGVQSEPAATLSEATVQNEGLISMNCGNLELDIDNVSNIWFVIPSNIPRANNTLELTFSDGTNTQTVERTWSATAQPIGRNKVRWESTENNEPFLFNTFGDAYVIYQPWQFLEYAYLVTNSAYNRESGPTAIIPTWNALTKKEYSDLPNMVVNPKYNPTTGALENYDGIKPAIIAKSLTFSIETIEDYIGTPGEGFWDSGLPTYYQGAYGYYIQNDGAIPTINSKSEYWPYSITGLKQSGENGVYPSLINLTIEGTSLFNGVSTSEYQVHINNLVLDGVTVDATEVEGATAAYFLGNNSYTNAQYDNITIKDNCVLKQPSTSTKPDALFGTAYTSPFPVVSNTMDETLFAVNLMANGNFSFAVEGQGIDEFQNIYPTTKGVLLTVEGKEDSGETNASTLISKIRKTYNASCEPYSVLNNLENTTSYWTGTAYWNTAKPFTAEKLAALAQNNYGTAPANLDCDINLMGSNGEYWYYTMYDSRNGMTVNGNGNTISNVYINGTMNGKGDAGKYLTLFGESSSVSELTVDGIIIENSLKKEGVYIGALSAWQNESSDNTDITVNKMKVISEAAQYNAVGGLYAASGSWKSLSELQFTNRESYNVSSTIGVGYAIGWLNFNTPQEVNVNVSSLGFGDYAYGRITFTINAKSGNTSGTNLNFDEDFTDGFIAGLPTNSKVVFNAGNNVYDGYTVWLQNSDGKVIAAIQYNEADDEWIKKIL